MRSASTAHLVPEAHPAHALLSVAHALLTPANAIAAPDTRSDVTILPIEEVSLPAPDVTDFRDVVDAINRLCDTMKNSYETSASEVWVDSELLEPEEVTVLTVETQQAETWSELSVTSDEQQQPSGFCDPISEYYTASSEVSLLSDMELPDKCQNEHVEMSLLSDTELPDKCKKELVETSLLPDRCQDKVDETLLSDIKIPDRCQNEPVETSLLSDITLHDKNQNEPVETEGKGCVMAGHVAAMRERFESMTRANTPCPDLVRSSSPTLDVFRITPSPDSLG